MFAVALISAAALAYEILLMRLFSIIQWHHFAYMMISVAMLGYGAAGSFVTLAQQRLRQHYAYVFTGCTLLFGLAALAGFALAQRVAFNPLEILWDPQQPLRLLTIYALLFVPFFFAATALCLTFAHFGTLAHRIYAYDIIGAGAGSLGLLAALFAIPPTRALALVCTLALLAAALAARSMGGPRWLPPTLALAAALPLAAPQTWITLQASPYKDLSQALRVPDARVIVERSSPLGVVSIVDSPRVPFRHAPGMSLNAPAEPPAQLGVFIDGDGPSALVRYDGDLAPLSYLDYLTSALPMHLLERPRVLVLGAGAGADVLQALRAGALTVDAVELNRDLIDLVQGELAAFSGRPYSAPGVRLHIGEARGFVAADPTRYDLIQVALLDAFGAASAGLYALSESYLYTLEALQAYLHRLDDGGLLAITRWVSLPPRDTLKLFATAVQALQRQGVGDASRRLALIRGWKTATLLVKNGAFSARDIAAMKAFCQARSFDLEYYPGITAGEANRHNVLDRSYFFDGAQALLGAERERFIAGYKFDIAPATDTRPYFFHFFKWSSLRELLALKDQGGLPLLDWGYPIIIATLAQAAAAGALLIVLPLAWKRAPAGAAQRRAPFLRVAIYFLALGVGFMFIEIAFMQKFALFLSHPLYAVTAVLAAFLIFAGLGSRCTHQLVRPAAGRHVLWPAAAIVALALLYLAVLPSVLEPLLGSGAALKIGLTIALIAPLAFFMGMPFPIGLAQLAAHAPTLIPWAWGINACASVIATILAALTAIHFGFDTVVLIAVCLYVLAAAAVPRATVEAASAPRSTAG